MVGDPRSRTDSIIMRSLIKLAIHSAMYTSSTFALIGAILDFSFGFYDTRMYGTFAFQSVLGSRYLISLLVKFDSGRPTLPDDAANGLNGRGTIEAGLPSFVSALPKRGQRQDRLRARFESAPIAFTTS